MRFEVMISHLRIKGFKSLANITVELGAVNVFIGANGSGKSNLLEAIGVLGAAIFGSVEPETLLYRGVRLGRNDSYASSFKSISSQQLVIRARNSESRYKIGFRNLIFAAKESRWPIASEELFDGPRKLLYRLGKNCIIYKRVRKNSSKESYQRLGIPITPVQNDESVASLALRIQGDGTPNASLMLQNIENYAIYSPTTSVLREVAIDVTRDPIGLGGSGLSRVIEELIDREANRFGPFDLDDVWELIDWAEDVSSIPASRARVSPALKTGQEVVTFRDKFMKKHRSSLSAYEASEGALYVLFMLALVGHPRSPRMFGIDNFDQSLHPRLACALTRVISEQIVNNGSQQMLATTHNPLVLDGLDLLDDRIRLFAVDRDEKGATLINRILVTEELMAQADKGLSLSRLWLMGRLGGVPKNL